MAESSQPLLQEEQPRTFAEFLESSPPDAEEKVTSIGVVSQQGGGLTLRELDIQLHCPSETCNGVRVFALQSGTLVGTTWSHEFLRFYCRNCRKTTKTYALCIRQEKSGYASGVVRKLGELPTFGPPVPARVITLIGPDRELFLRGRRAENHGLGIGAFAYYRRVVENQKGRIIGEIGRVAERLGANEQAAKLFTEAAAETQFKTAIEKVKSAIPQSLLVQGHNPLTLLHTALSEGLHDLPEEECLALATTIRVVLTDLAERISQALKDDAELKEAVSRLLNRSAAK